ncbi:hypothetical protein [Terricaulis sp.]|uniref:hypothetical protein n=1 Tax=Terricaulis sp. TaxID=2768686 RepID=UPI003782D2AB
MPKNILDQAPIDALARKMAEKIPHTAVAARFARLAFERLRDDPRNFRPATLLELKKAKPWAMREMEAGREVVAFVANRSCAARLRRTAAALAETCAEASFVVDPASPTPSSRDAWLRASATEFIAKIDRANYEVMEGKARLFALERKNRETERLTAVQLYAHEDVYSAPGRTWRRIVSLAELWSVGREFHNCLARSSRYIGAYGRRLRDGDAQFWVLRDQTGRGLIVAMVCMLEKRICEVRLPRNGGVHPDDPDIVRLGEAKGWRRPNGNFGPPEAPVLSAQPPSPLPLSAYLINFNPRARRQPN